MNTGDAFELDSRDIDEAPAAPQRRPRGRATGKRAPRAPSATGEGRAARLLRLSIPVLYVLSFLLTALAIYATSHEGFGELARGAFWDAFRGRDGSFAFPWHRNTFRMAGLVLLAIAWLAAVLSPGGRRRAAWVLAWIAIATSIFSTNREELSQHLLWVLIGLAAGCVLYLCRNPEGSKKLVLIVWVLILAELFMPLPPNDEFGLDGLSYQSIGVELVTAHIDGPQFEYLRSDEPPGRLEQHWDFFVGALPPHLLLIAFLFLSLALVGVRGPVFGTVQVIVFVAGLLGAMWSIYTTGTESGIIGFPQATETWAGLHLLGASLHGRFLCFLPALVAGLAELGTRDSGRSAA